MKKLLFILLFPLQLFATNYFVSNTGSDAAAGTATGTAWLTITKINGASFASGDSILFNVAIHGQELQLFRRGVMFIMVRMVQVQIQ